MAPQVPRWNTRDAPVRCSESKALSCSAMAMMMLMGQKTRTFVVLSQKTVLTRKVSRQSTQLEAQGRDLRFRPIIRALVMGEPDRHRRQITARDGMAGNHQQYVLVAEGLGPPTLRGLLLEKLADSF